MIHPKLLKFLSTSLLLLDAIFLAYIYLIAPLWVYILCVILYLIYGRSLDNYFNIIIFIIALVRDLFIVAVNSYLPLLILSLGIIYQIILYKIFKLKLFTLATNMSAFERSLQRMGKKPTFHQAKRSMPLVYEKLYGRSYSNKDVHYNNTPQAPSSTTEDNYEIFDEDGDYEDFIETPYFSETVDMCRDIIKKCQSELPLEYISAEDIIVDKFYDHLYENSEASLEEDDIYFAILNICFDLISSGNFHNSLGELDEDSEAPALCLVFDNCINWLKENEHLTAEKCDQISAELQENINSAG